MIWNNVAKPTASVFSAINPQGREFYDQSDVIYDSPTTFYDGIDFSQWNDVAKPVSSVWTKIAKPV